jgi:hypothetical protein
VPVGRRCERGLRRGKEARARLVLDDNRLSEALGKLVAVQARDDIHAGAGRERHDDRDGPRRIILRERRPRVHRDQCKCQQRAAQQQPRHQSLPVAMALVVPALVPATRYQ